MAASLVLCFLASCRPGGQGLLTAPRGRSQVLAMWPFPQYIVSLRPAGDLFPRMAQFTFVGLTGLGSGPPRNISPLSNSESTDQLLNHESAIPWYSKHLPHPQKKKNTEEEGIPQACISMCIRGGKLGPNLEFCLPQLCSYFVIITIS